MKIYEILVESHLPRLKSVLAQLIKLLHDNNVNYVIGGAQALSLYTKHPRMSVDIDAFIDHNEKQRLDQLLSSYFELLYSHSFHSKFKSEDVEIDILYAGNEADDYAIKHKRSGTILGVSLNTVSPEALLWLYVVSTKEQNKHDAVELLRSTTINLDEVRAEVHQHDPELSSHLEELIRKSSVQPQPRRTKR